MKVAHFVFVVVVIHIDFIVQLEVVLDLFDGHFPGHLYCSVPHCDAQLGVELGRGLALN